MNESRENQALAETVAAESIRYYRHLASRVDRAVRSLPKEKFWVKPFPFGNDVGHLVLHLTGNLNHFIGAMIAKTGYVRDRPREFTEEARPEAEHVLAEFQKAIDMVVRTIDSLDAAGLAQPIDAHPPSQTAFGLILHCASHLNNHIGQMSYLVQALGYSTDEPPLW
jgi:uncharacterized damage-inducible protein DinB